MHVAMYQIDEPVFAASAHPIFHARGTMTSLVSRFP